MGVGASYLEDTRQIRNCLGHARWSHSYPSGWKGWNKEEDWERLSSGSSEQNQRTHREEKPPSAHPLSAPRITKHPLQSLAHKKHSVHLHLTDSWRVGELRLWLCCPFSPSRIGKMTNTAIFKETSWGETELRTPRSCVLHHFQGSAFAFPALPLCQVCLLSLSSDEDQGWGCRLIVEAHF